MKSLEKQLSSFAKFCKRHGKMETQKTVNLLNSSENGSSKFATKKWFLINNQSGGNYSKDETIKFLTKSIETSLCEYSDAYILVTGK